MPTDIKLTDGEIALGNADFELVEGAACVVQDLLERLNTDAGALFYDASFGAGLKRFIHAPEEECVELKAEVLKALKADPRILAERSHIEALVNKGVWAVEISFEIDQGPSRLVLHLGEELTVYEGRIP